MKLLVLSVAMFAMPFANAEGEIETPTSEVVENEQEPTTEEIVDETPTTNENEVVVVDGEEKFDFGEWLREYFTPERIAMITSWVSYATTIIIVAIKWAQLFKKKNATIDEVAVLVKETIDQVLTDELKKEILPKLDELDSNFKNYKAKESEQREALARIIALSQQNDASSRVAILREIATLGLIDKEIIESAEKVIVANEQANVEATEQAVNKLDEIINETEVSGLGI